MEKKLMFTVVKRGIKLSVFESNGNYTLEIGNDAYNTNPSKFGNKFAWFVPEEAAKKHFGINQASWLEHETAKEIVNAKNRRNQAAYRDYLQEKNDFLRVGKKYE